MPPDDTSANTHDAPPTPSGSSPEATPGDSPPGTTPGSILLELPQERFAPPRRATVDARLVFLTLLRVGDGILLGGAALAAHAVVLDDPTPPPASMLVIAAGVALALHQLNARGAYDLVRLRRLSSQLYRTALAWAVALALPVGLAYSTRNLASLSRPWLVLWAALGLSGLYAGRLLVWLWLRRPGTLAPRIALIGEGDPLLQFKRVSDPGQYSLAAELTPENTAGIDALEDAIQNGEIDEIVLALAWSERGDRLAQVLGKLRTLAVDVRLFPHMAALGLPLRGVSHTVGIPLLQIFERPLSGWNLLLKNAFDRVLACLLLVVFSPLFALVAAAIKLTSPGPVLFSQGRWGFNGNEFQVYKFRSMHTRPAETNVPQATRNDPRVTPLGALIRRTSIDELPQLLNVVKGDMSLVGPRPHAVAHNVHYAAIVDGYLGRHRVKPGMTGWAQIHGYRGETDTLEKMQRRVQFDLYYIDHWSLLLDIKILLRTPLALLGKNAY